MADMHRARRVPKSAELQLSEEVQKNNDLWRQLAEMTQERDRLLQQLAELTRDRQDFASEALDIIQQVRRQKDAAIQRLCQGWHRLQGLPEL